MRILRVDKDEFELEDATVMNEVAQEEMGTRRN
jgi:hypothetical protein